MKITTQLLELLKCPSSSEALSLDNEHSLLSSDGSQAYPIVDGIPWLIAHPRNSLLDWGAKLNHFQQIFLQEITRIELDLKTADGATFDRLTRLLEAKRNFLLQVTTLLEPLVQTKVAPSEIYDALRDKAPSTQNLLSYEANIYRDWVWGDEENILTKDLLADVFPEHVGKLAVLGAGACRLAFDLHQKFKPELTVATDINPLFLLLANKLLSGDGFELTEFPLHPKSSDLVAKTHFFEAPEAIPENFYLCFADAARPAFKAASFDTLVTPWVIDIQPHELSTFLKQLNHYLPIGGSWVNFGSLVFQQDRESLCYSVEEVESLAIDAGFEIKELKQHEIPYLKSPYNAGYRMETVCLWRAVKLKDVDREKDLQNLPSWILNTTDPIPLTQEFQSTYAQSHFLSELFQKVDGRHSIETISAYFANRDGSDPSEIEGMLTQYFQRFFN